MSDKEDIQNSILKLQRYMRAVDAVLEWHNRRLTHSKPLFDLSNIPGIEEVEIVEYYSKMGNQTFLKDQYNDMAKRLLMLFALKVIREEGRGVEAINKQKHLEVWTKIVRKYTVRPHLVKRTLQLFDASKLEKEMYNPL